MFGFTRLRKHGATEDERELYRAHFCGSCHAMHAFGGRWTSLLTNYDQTVLALALGALHEPSRARRARCTALPFRSVEVQELAEPGKTLLAALNVAAVEAKLRDDVDDEGRWRHRWALRLLGRQALRAQAALRGFGFPLSVLEELPARQRSVEAAASPSLSSLAAPSAELTGAMFGFAAACSGRLDLRAPLRQLGEALGRFVYVWDAVVDRTDDRRRGRFNAVEACFGGAPCRDVLRAWLRSELARADEALDRLPARPQVGVIQRIVASLRHRLHFDLPRHATAWGGVLPTLAELRPAEAGDCDCGVCDSIDCCTGGDCGCEGVDCCVFCCEPCGDRRRRRQEREDRD